MLFVLPSDGPPAPDGRTEKPMVRARDRIARAYELRLAERRIIPQSMHGRSLCLYDPICGAQQQAVAGLWAIAQPERSSERQNAPMPSSLG